MSHILEKIQNTLVNTGKYDKAITEIEKLIKKYYTNPAVLGCGLNTIGICYFNQKQYKKAIIFFEKILQIKEIGDVYKNISNCYTNLRKYNKAIKYLNKATKLEPQNSNIYFALGNIYFYKKQYHLSEKYYNKAINITPLAHYKYNLSFTYLAQQKFLKGFELYETRLLIEKKHRDNLVNRLQIPQLPYWNKENKNCKLLVISEQGLGDNIQYFRFVEELANKFPEMKITFFTKQELSHLFISNKVEIIKSLIYIQDYDYKLYLMSLPYILGVNSIKPSNMCYIQTNSEKKNFWKKKFYSMKGLKVGIVWRGLLESFIQKNIPINYFESLMDLDINLISLHKEEKFNNDLQILKQKYPNRVHTFDIDNDKPFVDTIAIMSNIDILLSIDTVTVHLAGVLGIKTYLLLGKYSDWRWFDEDTPNVWYSNVKNIRMKANQNWKDVISVCRENILNLNTKFIKPPIPKIPVSIGELFDKYTILKIKTQRIKNPCKLKIVKNEHSLLKKYTNNYNIDNELVTNLEDINNELWEIEDKIREKEAKKEFDEEFVQIARSVYIKNDLRAKIKKQINDISGSDIIEVKNYQTYT